MKYYVYILMDDRFHGNYGNQYCDITHKPFYVGKGFYGTKNKSERHLIHYKLSNGGCDKSSNPQKCRIIQKLINGGFQPNFKIVYEDDIEDNVFKVETELINFYERKSNGGILTNICEGGNGGDTFTNNPNKEGIREKHRINALGEKNGMYGLKLEERPSHIAKLNGSHWNLGKTMSENHKKILKKLREDRLPIIQQIDKRTFEVLDELQIFDIIKKYGLSYNRLYFCLTKGGEHRGYYWKYKEKELVLKKTLRPDYQKPKRVIKCKKVFYKKLINDINEIEYNNVIDASNNIGLSIKTIRLKCKMNNDTLNVFRYENSDYNFEGIKSKKIPIIRVDGLGNEVVFDSVTDASKSLNNGSVSMIVQVCKGNRKKHKGFTFKYLKK
jgi:hypothetical protein